MGPELLREALRASGVGRGEVSLHLSRLEALVGQFTAAPPPSGDYALAQALFRWLWQDKPQRYQPGGEFRLHRVIESQLSPRPGPVGNCLGLTLLYNALAEGLGLRVGAIYLEEAFGRGPHTLSLLYTEAGTVDIENIFPTGFDYPGHRGSPLREEWSEEDLVAEVYVAVGNQLFDGGDLRGAIARYDQALALSPSFRKALVNRAIAQGKLS